MCLREREREREHKHHVIGTIAYMLINTDMHRINLITSQCIGTS